MKVKSIISILDKYDEDDEVIVMWWDIDTLNDRLEDEESLTESEWQAYDKVKEREL